MENVNNFKRARLPLCFCLKALTHIFDTFHPFLHGQCPKIPLDRCQNRRVYNIRVSDVHTKKTIGCQTFISVRIRLTQ